MDGLPDAVVLIDLADATAQTCGGKAPPLGALLRAGFPVPPGFVVPAGVERLDLGALARELARIAPGEGYVAVRSSGGEDAADRSAAGQYDSVLGVRGADRVADAVRHCRASAWSPRAVAYRQPGPAGMADIEPGAIAVLVQPLVDADVAGVMFTGETVRIEGSGGLGVSVVSGLVTADAWVVSDGVVVRRVVGAKGSRADRVGAGMATREVAADDRDHLCLSDDDVLHLARLGRDVDGLLGGPRDIEWAMADRQAWILQARPVTAALPAVADGPAACALAGTPGSAGRATGPARVVLSPDDFGRVHAGDVLICRTTDPAWTPLFRVVAAVVTETGGVLSHAAIVARELGLPAVVAVPDVTRVVADGVPVEVDGNAGRVSPVGPAWRG